MTYLSATSINTTKGFGEIFNYVNAITVNWISNMFLVSIYVIILIGFYKAKEDFKGALAVAGYGTFVVGLLFWIGGFISGWAMGLALGSALIGTLVLLLDSD